jgi:flagellar hook-length control protein FliK
LITDLANLGPSLKGASDLGVSRGAGKPGQSKASQAEKPEQASSFEQIFQKKVDDLSDKSDKNVRANYAKPDPKPIQKDMEKVNPEQPDVNQAQTSSSRNEPRTARKENENWEEPGSVRKEESSEKVGEKTNSQSPQRENVMLQFMDSMESEFGIPPTRLVEAMTHIPESDQLSSPEDSALQVIGQLDLPPEQEQRALALYMGMLAALKQPTEITPKPFVVASAAAAVPTALMANQERKLKLNNSLDSMNQKFFMKAPKEPSDALMKTADFEKMKPETKPFLPEDLTSQLQPNEVPTKLPNLLPQNEVTKNYGPQIPKFDLQNIDPNSAEAKELMKHLAALGTAATALNQEIQADPKTLQALKAEQALQSLNGPTTAGAATAIAALGLDADGGEDEGDLGGDRSPKEQLSIHGNHGSSVPHTRGEASNATTSFGAALAASQASNASGTEKQESIQQLMKQAQYMMKKGGGEAKITMNPEGLGEIHMKVTVNEGKVNLEMSAQTKEAKKLIESSMDELRSGLGQHKLTMDQVKVDVGNQTASDSNSESQKQQRQMNMNQDQSKDQARQFWSEFNNGGGFDRRGTFFDNPAIRAYGGSNKVEALTPSSSSGVGESRYTGSGKGRGLNLVA